MMKQRIQQELQVVEATYGVKILYACESGSRAWGFPSADSDYDGRFLYIHPPDWYLSIDLEHKRNVIERPLHDSLDLSGWDLRKALKLFYKSNPPLLEWLGSPLVYWDRYTVAQRLREFAPRYYNPLACSYHYLHMAQGNYREYLQGERVWVKKYFYVLRPILAINWLERGLGVVPTEFSVMVEGLITSPALKRQIEDLIAAKKAGQELDDGPRIPEIAEFVEVEMTRLTSNRFEVAIEKQPVEPLNTLFRSVLAEVWQS